MNRSTPRITQDPSRPAAETAAPAPPAVRVAALLAPPQAVPTLRNRVLGSAASRPLGNVPARDSTSRGESRGRPDPASFSAVNGPGGLFAAATGATQASLAALANAEAVLAEASAVNKVEAAEMPVRGQIVGATVAMMTQAVESLAKAGKDAVVAQGQAFDKAR